MNNRSLKKSVTIENCRLEIQLERQQMLGPDGALIRYTCGVIIMLKNVTVHVPEHDLSMWQGDPRGTYDGRLLWSTPISTALPRSVIQIFNDTQSILTWAMCPPWKRQKKVRNEHSV